MDRQIPSKISVIVTTYNWPHALRAVLNALLAQKTTQAFEIIVADDGSNEETEKLIRSFKLRGTIPILHIWQPDEGFRAAAIRNKAILAAEGDYIIFLDGDCIPRKNFINRQVELISAKTFISGNRVLLSRDFTVRALSEDLPLHEWPFYKWCLARLRGHCNRLLPFVSLRLGKLLKNTATRWKGAKGCNLAAWKADLLLVNGWEEQFVGWGYEDSDLVIRLLRLGVKRKDGRFRIPVIHLWHPENDRAREQDNRLLLKAREDSECLLAEKGLNQYIL